MSGEGILELENQKIAVPEGSGFLLYPGDKHSYHPASEVGFESNSYFSTVFKKQEGIGPNKFREYNSLI
ncbi:MAG: hypothetical protein B6241_07955 [Spirochaetaceae bacterium 4572_59]|nr:MAG: hypothetical protein B6241_07955 [Spirochaetaceae bacterium 4572_59]